MIQELIASTGFSIIIVTLLFTPLAALVLTTLAGKKRSIETITAVSTFLILIQGIILVAAVISEKTVTAFNGLFYVDALSAVVLLPITLVGFVAALYSINYIGRQYNNGFIDHKQLVRYYQEFNLFIFTMLLVPVSNNLGLMWVAMEATTLVSVLLIMLYVKEDAIEAAWKYLIVATVGLSFAFFGITFFYYANTNAVASDLDEGLNWTIMLSNAELFDPTIVKIAFIFILVGYGTKAGLAPMHTWLPDAHSEAPTPVSALLSGVLLNCAIYAIVRFHIISSNAIGSLFSSQLLIILGVVSIGIAAASIYFQRDMKRMLAYSSVEHMGIVAFAIGTGGLIGIYGAVLHIINHAIAKPLMFFASGTVSQKFETKAMRHIKGVITVMPATGALFLLGGLAIVGMPPFNIFLSEFLILSSGFNSGQFIASSLVILFLIVIFASFTGHLVRMVFGTPRKAMKKGDLGNLAVIPMIILVVLALILGVYVPEPLQILARDVSTIINQGGLPK